MKAFPLSIFLSLVSSACLPFCLFFVSSICPSVHLSSVVPTILHFIRPAFFLFKHHQMHLCLTLSALILFTRPSSFCGAISLNSSIPLSFRLRFVSFTVCPSVRLYVDCHSSYILCPPILLRAVNDWFLLMKAVTFILIVCIFTF